MLFNSYCNESIISFRFLIIYRKSVPPETHLKLKKQLNDLLRKQREFGAVLSMADTPMIPGNMSLNANPTAIDFPNNVSYDHFEINWCVLNSVAQRLYIGSPMACIISHFFPL